MPQEELTGLDLIEQLQLSLDAVGTIVNTDLPEIQDQIAVLYDRVGEIGDSQKAEHISINGLSSSMQDVDAKLDILLGKVDLLERKLGELMQDV